MLKRSTYGIGQKSRRSLSCFPNRTADNGNAERPRIGYAKVEVSES
jgi:hypothetical protein